MGLFDIFRKKSAERSAAPPRPAMPTVKPRKELFDAYDKVFYDEMSKVEGLTEEEVAQLHKLIKNSDGGYLNQSAYHQQGFDRYFKRRAWVWREYEDWNATFANMGKYPVKWIHKAEPKVEVWQVFGKMKVAELKEFLERHQVAVPAKAKKDDLIALSQTVPNYQATNEWQQAHDAMEDRKGYALYELLMRTISFRAKGLDDKRRRSELDVGSKLMVVFDEERKFIDLALKKNPNALPPFFPGDMTILSTKIEGFD